MELKKAFDENIYYYTEVFENPQWIIDSLEKMDSDQNTYNSITKWYNWLASNDPSNSFGKKKDLFYHNKDSVVGENSELAKQVIEEMRAGVERICHAFVKDRGLGIDPNISPFLDMCKYTPGGSLGVHHDSQDGDRSLLYSIVMYFNDDCEGGEISFSIDREGKHRPGDSLDDPNIDFWIKPKPGSALIFPSTYPYLHQSHPIKSGNKYMSTAFIFVEGYDCQNPEHVRKYREKI
jgi:hypothetical protein